jgi:hypothetical protein
MEFKVGDRVRLKKDCIPEDWVITKVSEDSILTISMTMSDIPPMRSMILSFKELDAAIGYWDFRFELVKPKKKRKMV